MDCGVIGKGSIHSLTFTGRAIAVFVLVVGRLAAPRCANGPRSQREKPGSTIIMPGTGDLKKKLSVMVTGAIAPRSGEGETGFL
ncbi:MAG: hypothetical protein EBE86_019690 [Hormoscilla sp. GUM202]|nr:hypothetical protein [Hormoscilla sp. GUM202]